MKKCYQYDNQGYFQFVDLDYGQGLPHNATYIKPPEEKEGFLLKFNGQSWEYEEIPKEEEEKTTESLLSEEEIALLELKVTYDGLKSEAMRLYQHHTALGNEASASAWMEKYQVLNQEYVSKYREIKGLT